jgi:C4-dicarboxylate transporter DctQ subunit
MGNSAAQRGKHPFDLIIDTMAFVAGVLLLAIALIVTYAVTLRYLNIRPPIWVLQYTEYGLLWVTFLGAAWLQRKQGHICIDTFTANLREPIRLKLDILNSLLGCLIAAVIFYFGLLHTINLFSRGVLDVNAVNVPEYMVFCVIPFGSFMLFLQFVRNTWQAIKENRREKTA